MTAPTIEITVIKREIDQTCILCRLRQWWIGLRRRRPC